MDVPPSVPKDLQNASRKKDSIVLLNARSAQTELKRFTSETDGFLSSLEALLSDSSCIVKGIRSSVGLTPRAPTTKSAAASTQQLRITQQDGCADVEPLSPRFAAQQLTTRQLKPLALFEMDIQSVDPAAEPSSPRTPRALSSFKSLHIPIGGSSRSAGPPLWPKMAQLFSAKPRTGHPINTPSKPDVQDIQDNMPDPDAQIDLPGLISDEAPSASTTTDMRPSVPPLRIPGASEDGTSPTRTPTSARPWTSRHVTFMSVDQPSSPGDGSLPAWQTALSPRKRPLLSVNVSPAAAKQPAASPVSILVTSPSMSQRVPSRSSSFRSLHASSSSNSGHVSPPQRSRSGGSRSASMNGSCTTVSPDPTAPVSRSPSASQQCMNIPGISNLVCSAAPAYASQPAAPQTNDWSTERSRLVQLRCSSPAASRAVGGVQHAVVLTAGGEKQSPGAGTDSMSVHVSRPLKPSAGGLAARKHASYSHPYASPVKFEAKQCTGTASTTSRKAAGSLPVVSSGAAGAAGKDSKSFVSVKLPKRKM